MNSEQAKQLLGRAGELGLQGISLIGERNAYAAGWDHALQTLLQSDTQPSSVPAQPPPDNDPKKALWAIQEDSKEIFG